MPGIHSVIIFFDDREEAAVGTEYEKMDVIWPVTIRLTTDDTYTHIHLSQKQFIKLKNSIISLDRTIEEERNA